MPQTKPSNEDTLEITAQRISDLVLSVTGGPAPLHAPEIRGKEWLYVKECLDSGWVSTAGKFVDKFETDLASYLDVGHVISTVNGTAALHICMLLAGVQANDEVLVQSLTFVATANAISYCQAIPHFVDSSESSLGLDPEKLDDHLKEIATVTKDGCVNRLTGRRIRAVTCMHVFGHPVDLSSLLEVCDRYNLILIEDAAESLGSLYKGKAAGSYGVVSALSFNGNKTITTGGGGAVVTNDPELAKHARHLTTTAKVSHAWEFEHDEIGYNYRMPNLNAAMGIAQLEMLPEFLAQKRILKTQYANAFANLKGLRFIEEPENSKSNYWLNAILLNPEFAHLRNPILKTTNDAGLLTRPVWRPMHLLDMFAACPRMDLSVCEQLAARLINLPSNGSLADGNT